MSRDVAGPFLSSGQAPTGATVPRLCYALANMDAKNRLYFGDNLKILREDVPDASVNLIYLDPPFNSCATNNVLAKQAVQRWFQETDLMLDAP